MVYPGIITWENQKAKTNGKLKDQALAGNEITRSQPIEEKYNFRWYDYSKRLRK